MPIQVQFTDSVIEKYEMKQWKRRALKVGINTVCDWNFYLARRLYGRVNDEEKRLMRDRYLSLFEEGVTVNRKEFVNFGMQAQIIVTPAPKQVKQTITVETKKVQTVTVQTTKQQQPTSHPKQIKSTPSIKQQFNKLTKSANLPSFKKLPIQKLQQQPMPPQKPQFERYLSLKSSLKQSHLQLQDIMSPNHQEQTSQIRRINTFSHYQKQITSSQRLSEHLNISISEEYSYLLGSDDEGKDVEIEEEEPKKVVQKRMIRKKEFKKQITLEKEEEQVAVELKENNTQAQKQIIGKTQIYLQTGASYYKLQRKLLLLYQNNIVSIVSIKNIVIESLKILKLRPLRNDFYQLKGETLEGVATSRIIRFKGSSALFAKYMESSN